MLFAALHDGYELVAVFVVMLVVDVTVDETLELWLVGDVVESKLCVEVLLDVVEVTLVLEAAPP